MTAPKRTHSNKYVLLRGNSPRKLTNNNTPEIRSTPRLLSDCLLTPSERGGGLYSLAGTPFPVLAYFDSEEAFKWLSFTKRPFISINELKHCLDLRPGNHGFFFF